MLLLFLLLGPLVAWADDDQVTLTPALVDAFISAHADLNALSLNFIKKYGDRSEEAGDDPSLALPAYQDIDEARLSTTTILVKYGFLDLGDYERVLNSVLLAYQYLDPATTPPDVATEKAKVRAEIDNDKSLTAEAKTQALADLDAQYAELAAFVPLAGNVDTIRSYAEKLRPIAEAN